MEIVPTQELVEMGSMVYEIIGVLISGIILLIGIGVKILLKKYGLDSEKNITLVDKSLNKIEEKAKEKAKKTIDDIIEEKVKEREKKEHIEEVK